MKKILRIATVAVAGALLACLSACGGGGGGGAIVPVVFNITTTTLADGVVGTAYSQTMAVTGGFGAKTFSISAGALPAGLSLNAATGAITGVPTAPIGAASFTVTVEDTSTPPQSDSQALTIDIVNPLLITTVALPDATVGTAYNRAITATGGTGPNTFTISAGSLPAGLSISAAGAITGTALATATNQTFTVRVADSSSPQLTDTQVLTIVVIGGSLGRNDSIGTATTLSNGTFAASISPSGNPNTTLAPDIDVYRVTANAGAIVTINVLGPGLSPPTSLDPVLEIVNAGNVRFANNCRDPGDDSVPLPITQDATPAAFDDQCINDDLDLGVTRDSMLEFQVPGAGVVTFYVRVLSFDGNARPDLRYEITVGGAN